jgi:hypothetical protein
MERISFSVTIQVAGGPSLPIAGTLEVEAYEKFDIAVPPSVAGTNGSAKISVAPVDISKVQLLVIISDINDGTIKFQHSSSSTSPPQGVIDLKGPVTLIGTSAVSLLNADTADLTFTNSGSQAARVTLLVGRDASA